MSRVLPLAAVAFLISGCWAGSVNTQAARRSDPSPAAPQPFPAQPGIIRASVAASRPVPGRLYRPPGTAVIGADIGTRAVGTDRVAYGLANRGAYEGTAWPVISIDAGRHWRIDGPPFYFAGAAGPSVTDSIGAHGADIAWAWGQSGNLVKVTTDRGRHWWVADFPAGLKAVRWEAGHLTAFAFWAGLRVFRYVSPDNGRTWRLQRG